MPEQTIFYINQGRNRTVRTLETLSETNDLSIGQVFIAVATHYGKCKDDYPRWISFSKNRSEFYVIQERIDECATDLEKLHLVCDWLGEEPIA